MNENTKLKFGKFGNIILWSIRISLKVSPFWTIAYFINEICQRVLPILTALFSSLIISELVNLISTHSTVISSSMLMYISLSVLFIIMQRILGTLNSYIYIRLNYLLDLNLYTHYLEKLASLDMQYHENPEFKSSLRKINDTLAWRMMDTIFRICSLSGEVIGSLLTISLFFVINPFLIFLIIIPIVVNYYINSKFGREVWGIWSFKGEEKKDAEHALQGLTDKEIIQEAKIYGFGNYIANKYNIANKSFINAVIKTSNLRYLFLSINNILSAIILAGIQVYLISQTIVGRISLQGYTFYLENINQIGSVLDAIQTDVSKIYENSLYIIEYKEFRELEDKVPKPLNSIVIDDLKAPSIEFKNVSFKYPMSENYIYKNLSFKINAGEKIALVGENGSGKTTIIKLLARFYDVNEGEILVNNINIKEIDLTSYYKLWGVLFQYFARYWFTLRENIGIGNLEDINNIELIKAAGEKADLSSIVEKLPFHYENMLSTDFDHGKDLSGGEWQKVGIARGLFANPKFIVLDEPTSALDALAEAKVFNEITHVASDTTMIIVSHRFATVRTADKIIVLENGQISEMGSHEQLMEHKKLYYKMFTSQAEGYK